MAAHACGLPGGPSMTRCAAGRNPERPRRCMMSCAASAASAQAASWTRPRRQHPGPRRRKAPAAEPAPRLPQMGRRAHARLDHPLQAHRPRLRTAGRTPRDHRLPAHDHHHEPPPRPDPSARPAARGSQWTAPISQLRWACPRLPTRIMWSAQGILEDVIPLRDARAPRRCTVAGSAVHAGLQALHRASLGQAVGRGWRAAAGRGLR
jgi:hypothetical protein